MRQRPGTPRPGVLLDRNLTGPQRARLSKHKGRKDSVPIPGRKPGFKSRTRAEKPPKNKRPPPKHHQKRNSQERSPRSVNTPSQFRRIERPQPTNRKNVPSDAKRESFWKMTPVKRDLPPEPVSKRTTPDVKIRLRKPYLS